jgi:hypothetical protein
MGADERTTRRGPAEIAKAAVVIAEGMKGDPLDEEIADVMADAIWDAYAAGKDSARRVKPPRDPGMRSRIEAALARAHAESVQEGSPWGGGVQWTIDLIREALAAPAPSAAPREASKIPGPPPASAVEPSRGPWCDGCRYYVANGCNEADWAGPVHDPKDPPCGGVARLPGAAPSAAPFDFTCSFCKRPQHDGDCAPGYPGDPRPAPSAAPRDPGVRCLKCGSPDYMTLECIPPIDVCCQCMTPWPEAARNETETCTACGHPEAAHLDATAPHRRCERDGCLCPDLAALPAPAPAPSAAPDTEGT